jgi:hypothetical protein
VEPLTVTPNDRRVLTAFGAGALCAFILPIFFFCILGAGLLLCTGYALTKNRLKE